MELTHVVKVCGMDPENICCIENIIIHKQKEKHQLMPLVQDAPQGLDSFPYYTQTCHSITSTTEPLNSV